MRNARIRLRLAAIVFAQVFLGGAALAALCFAVPLFLKVSEVRVHAAAFALLTVSTLVGILRAIIMLFQTAHMPGDFLERGAHSGDPERGGKEPPDGSSSR